MLKTKLTVASFFLISALRVLDAQTGTSFNLQGTLFDPSGATVPDATVTAKNVDLGLTRSGKTDQQGHYFLAALPLTGKYEVSVQATGFAPQTKSGLTFTANAESVVDFNLRPGTVQESVQVTTEAPMVETTKTELSHTVTEQSLENLPDNGRNFFDFVQ